ncbi:MAG: putative dehydrogenase [Planctomycetota bacterium]
MEEQGPAGGAHSEHRAGGDLRVGLVGAGFLAETRARCWARVPGARIVAVSARGSERAETFAKRWGIPSVEETSQGLSGRSDVDLVDLCVPNLAHRPLTEEAAAAGKHVLCTKPLAAYHGQDLKQGFEESEIAARDPHEKLSVAVGDAQAMVDATSKAGVRLFYGENWIFAPAIRRAAELLLASGGALLEMRGWECHKGSHSPYAKSWSTAGGGALLRLAAHPVGTMLYLKRLEGEKRLGRAIRPVSVTGEVADLTQVEGLTDENTMVSRGWVDVENWGCVVIRFDDGSRGIAYGSDNALGGMESKIELYASNHHMKCNLSPNDMLRAYAPDGQVFGEQYIMEKTDTSAGWSTPMPDEDWTSGQQPMCAAIADALRTNSACGADGALGVETTRVLYSAYISAHAGRRVDI